LGSKYYDESLSIKDYDKLKNDYFGYLEWYPKEMYR
jgi:hypothetical protein